MHCTHQWIYVRKISRVVWPGKLEFEDGVLAQCPNCNEATELYGRDVKHEHYYRKEQQRLEAEAALEELAAKGVIHEDRDDN